MKIETVEKGEDSSTSLLERDFHTCDDFNYFKDW